MTDFEKVQIGFDITWTIFGVIGLVLLGEIAQNTFDTYWNQKYGYTKWIGVA